MSCTKCETEQPLESFYFSKSGKKNSTWCKLCHKFSQIRNLYGLDRATYEAMAEQGCGICGSKSFLQVDHDHACCSGRKSCGRCVRALLCKRHNVLLGFLRDDPNEIYLVSEYLEKSRVS